MASAAAVTIPVLYATNRAKQPTALLSELGDEPGKVYADGQIGPLVLGTCSVTLIGGRASSDAGLPQDVKEVDWTSQVQGKEVLVFVHGYNNTFTNAVRAVARLKKDIPFDGHVIAFSWASWGRPDKYYEDQEINAQCIAPFLEFLKRLKATAKIHVLAHSMGNRIALQAVAGLFDGTPPTSFPLGQLIFASADEDSTAFRTTMSKLTTAGEGKTLYASCVDIALRASAEIHGYDRAGQMWPNLLVGDKVPYQSRRPFIVVPGLDTIDCTDAGFLDFGHDSHGYFAQPPVIDDIAQVLRGRGPASPERSTPPNAYGRLTRVQSSNTDASDPVLEVLEGLIGKRPEADGVWWRVNPKQFADVLSAEAPTMVSTTNLVDPMQDEAYVGTDATSAYQWLAKSIASIAVVDDTKTANDAVADVFGFDFTWLKAQHPEAKRRLADLLTRNGFVYTFDVGDWRYWEKPCASAAQSSPSNQQQSRPDSSNYSSEASSATHLSTPAGSSSESGAPAMSAVLTLADVKPVKGPGTSEDCQDCKPVQLSVQGAPEGTMESEPLEQQGDILTKRITLEPSQDFSRLLKWFSRTVTASASFVIRACQTDEQICIQILQLGGQIGLHDLFKGIIFEEVRLTVSDSHGRVYSLRQPSHTEVLKKCRAECEQLCKYEEKDWSFEAILGPKISKSSLEIGQVKFSSKGVEKLVKITDGGVDLPLVKLSKASSSAGGLRRGGCTVELQRLTLNTIATRQHGSAEGLVFSFVGSSGECFSGPVQFVASRYGRDDAGGQLHVDMSVKLSYLPELKKMQEVVPRIIKGKRRMTAACFEPGRSLNVS